MESKALPKRHDIPAEYTWNAPSVFESREAWEAAYQDLAVQLPSLKRFEGHLSDGPATLAEWMTLTSEMGITIGKLMVYAGMSSAVDTNDQAAVAMQGRGMMLVGQVQALTAFADPELLQIGWETLSQWIAQNADLAVYHHYIDRLFRKQQHIRSAEVEEVLGLLADNFSMPYRTYSMLTDADFKFTQAAENEPVAQSTITDLMNNPNREVRRTAWENYADRYLDYKHTLAANYLASVKQDAFEAHVRGYSGTLEAVLFPDNIPVEVFHNLIDTYKRFLPTWHRYWAIRRRILGFETLTPYDIWAPLSQTRPVVDYDQAIDWLTEALAPLGDDYVATMRQGSLENRWVDRYPNEGKSSGAFSSGAKGTHPFIMMSYANSLESMSTLAHELGHSMHSYLTWQHQPVIYSNYSSFVAEVASNFHQAMLRDYLFKNNPDPGFQIALIEEAMSNFHRYFFIMPTLARYEHEVHQRVEQGGSLTADDMIKLMTELFSEGYGSEMHIDHDRVGITWAQFPHLYAAYYPFQYATGISGAHALASRVLAGGSNAAEAYRGFLSSGSSGYPIDVLKQAGVDLTTPEPVEQTFAILTQYIDRLDQLTR